MLNLSLMLVLVVCVVPEQAAKVERQRSVATGNRDKNGTTGVDGKCRSTQNQLYLMFAASGSLRAEREGFELPSKSP
jgi:hypothetical protein